ncbi:Fur family transcriptional regulator [Dysgonomonas sp. BGC7]|uniref:Fur family transcriptional regulator n=1 Tax=Dysgonomonas sp. BGC7 TaxID=1658008 RepID=UPI0006824255|nr:transcriptional repressor [Dysgonomonas sp. BGC7]MBD8388319.1 transcriptional repressor [Dysgonomonas sp. BGC7]
MDVTNIIKNAGLKITPQRRIVYEVMTKLGHGTIDEVISEVQKQNPNITISTVYRILDSFCEVKLLSRVNHPNGKCYIDITPSDHHHIFTDEELIDYTDPELTELIKRYLDEKLCKKLDIDKISVQIIANLKKSNDHGKEEENDNSFGTSCS